jgi:DNA polymerase III delta prime subunit
MREQFLWVEKYRPKKVKDVILPDNLKNTFQGFVDSGNVPNLLLVGSAGTGKTTIAKAMADELNADYITINASLKRNIDTLRDEIANFASSVSFGGGRKYVILDEADYLNPTSFQPALRNFMEQFSRNTGFILTANFKNKIIEPLHSRCAVVEFKIPKDQKVKMAKLFMGRVCEILELEKLEYDKVVIAAVIQKFFPDWRRVLNELQYQSGTGSITSGALGGVDDNAMGSLLAAMKDKNFTEVRKWVAENMDNDSAGVFRDFYDTASRYFKPSYIPFLVVVIARYQYQDAFTVDKEINMAAALTEIMLEAQWI